ncbi:MAG: hypothetical protein BWK80_43835, partial [Desulfobacteraceae bacterium IS3]
MQIAPENFEPGSILGGYSSSPDESSPNEGIDNNDKGYVIDGYGAVSRAIILTDSVATADFGFYSCGLSLTAMIWNDINTDG